MEPSVSKVTSYQLFTRDLAKEEMALRLDGAVAQAGVEAAYARATANTATADVLTLAGSKTAVFYQTSAPANPTGSYALRTGDLWFNTTADGDGRISYRPSRWSGTAWVLVDAPTLIVASEIAAGAITAAKIAAGAVTADKLSGNIIQTANYAYTGTEGGASEVATAGAKMQMAAGGLALLAAMDGVKFGATKFSDLWSSGWVRSSAIATMTYNGSNAYVLLSNMTDASAGSSFVRGVVALGSTALSLKVTAAGNYKVTWGFTAKLPAADLLRGMLYKNGTTQVNEGYSMTQVLINTYGRIGRTCVLTLAANDELELAVWATSGGTTYLNVHDLLVERLPD